MILQSKQQESIGHIVGLQIEGKLLAEDRILWKWFGEVYSEKQLWEISISLVNTLSKEKVHCTD